ncbi:MAG TPA: wax ester/triacylglycerol synthase domain-containing protein [Acidimicrobiales bacterium]
MATRGLLSNSDSLLWRIGSDPLLRSPILVVALLDRRPSEARFRATLERACEALPQLRTRLVEPPLGIGRPAWEDDEQFSLDHHVRREHLTTGGLRAVLDLAERDAVTAFDPARPLWMVDLVDGPNETNALVLRLHHAMIDGIAGIQMAERIFDRSRTVRGAARSTEPGRAAATPDGQHGVQAAAATFGRAVAGAAGRAAAATIRDPVSSVTSPLAFARSAARMLAPAPPAGSRLLTGRGLDRRLHTFRVRLAGLRATAYRAGGTVNDVLLAAVAGAVDAYHRELGSPIAAARVTMPINIRRPGDPEGGNRFTPARFALPVDDPDPIARIRIAHAIVRSWRDEPAVAGTPVLAAGLNLLPKPVVTRVFGGLLRSQDVNVSNVPGLVRPAYVGGARIERLAAFAPPTGAAFSVTLVSHGEDCEVAVMCDTAAVDQPDRMGQLVESGLADMVQVGARP